MVMVGAGGYLYGLWPAFAQGVVHYQGEGRVDSSALSVGGR